MTRCQLLPELTGGWVENSNGLVDDGPELLPRQQENRINFRGCAPLVVVADFQQILIPHGAVIMAFPTPYAPDKVTDMSRDDHGQEGAKAAKGRVLCGTAIKPVHRVPKGTDRFLLGVFLVCSS